MRKIMIMTAIAAGALTAAAPAAAVAKFASFVSTASGNNFNWVRSANNLAGNFGRNATFYTTSTASANVAGATNVQFFYNNLGGFSAAVSNIPATLLMQGTVTNTVATHDTGSGQITQTELTGSFSFTANNPITYGSASGTNLLSGTFSLLTLSGDRTGTQGNLGGSSAATSIINFTSDFLTFPLGSAFDIGFVINAITGANGLNALPLNAAPTMAISSFRGAIGGQFSANPKPLAPSIPEPGTWMMMIAGMSLVGFARRRRRVSVVA